MRHFVTLNQHGSELVMGHQKKSESRVDHIATHWLIFWKDYQVPFRFRSLLWMRPLVFQTSVVKAQQEHEEPSWRLQSVLMLQPSQTHRWLPRCAKSLVACVSRYAYLVASCALPVPCQCQVCSCPSKPIVAWVPSAQDAAFGFPRKSLKFPPSQPWSCHVYI